MEERNFCLGRLGSISSSLPFSLSLSTGQKRKKRELYGKKGKGEIGICLEDFPAGEWV